MAKLLNVLLANTTMSKKEEHMGTEMHIKGANNFSKEFSVNFDPFHIIHGGILQISDKPTGRCPF